MILSAITRANYPAAVAGDQDAQGVPLRILEHEATMYESVMHTCVHPLHAAVDPLCAYTIAADADKPRIVCDICRPIRILLGESV